jgi:hypothetical protein
LIKEAMLVAIELLLIILIPLLGIPLVLKHLPLILGDITQAGIEPAKDTQSSTEPADDAAISDAGLEEYHTGSLSVKDNPEDISTPVQPEESVPSVPEQQMETENAK